MKYQIKVYFHTGDSEKSFDEEAILEMSWKSLKKAEEAVKRIEEHYKWYELKNGYAWDDKKKVPEPSWHKTLDDHTIKIELDNGKEITFSAFWCGYFERLRSLEVIVAPLMKVVF